MACGHSQGRKAGAKNHQIALPDWAKELLHESQETAPEGAITTFDIASELNCGETTARKRVRELLASGKLIKAGYKVTRDAHGRCYRVRAYINK